MVVACYLYSPFSIFRATFLQHFLTVDNNLHPQTVNISPMDHKLSYLDYQHLISNGIQPLWLPESR